MVTLTKLVAVLDCDSSKLRVRVPYVTLMQVKIYSGHDESWWLVKADDTGIYMSPDGKWNEWVCNMRDYETLRIQDYSLWKKKFINSRRLAIAVAKKYIPNVRIVSSFPR